MNIAAAKLGLGLSLVLGSLGLVQTRAFSDELLGFMAAGIVPGTDIKISADVMLIFSALTLGSLLTLISRRSITTLCSKLPLLVPLGLRLYRSLVMLVRRMSMEIRHLYAQALPALENFIFEEASALGVLGRRYARRGMHSLKPWAEKAIAYLTPR